MFNWLLMAILAYLFFGFSSLGDKLVLGGDKEKAPNPKSYTFYVGVFGLLSIILIIPFIKFTLPSSIGLFWIMLDAVSRILGWYAMYVAVRKFDVSRVIATIGATQPIFIFILAWIFWGPQIMSGAEMLAFALLFIGSVIISIEKNIKLTLDYLKLTIFSSLMFSLEYIFAKSVFQNQTFLLGAVWIQIFIFLFVLVFLLSKKSRQEIFSKKIIIDKKNQLIFLATQVFGGVGNFLQSFAISLAPVVFLATVNSLRGIQYAFLFIVALLLSYFFPKVLHEELTRKIIFQKTFSILLIIIGLIILVS